MQKIKTLYLKNLVDDFWKRKIFVGAVMVLCILLFAALGVKSAQTIHELSKEQQQEVDEYNEKIQAYDDAIADAKEGLELAIEQADELQKYMDSSIYMKIDPQNIQVSSVQFGVRTEANTGNILNALVLYINEGGLKEALPEEYRDLSVENWREIVTPSISANLLNVTVIHYDGEQAQKILGLIKERLQAQIPEIAKVQGEFSLEEIDTSNYVKADSNVTNTQNNNRNNLKNYLSNKADFENKVISFQNNKESFIEKNQPEVLEASQPDLKATTIKYMIVGMIFGIVLPAAFFALQYILSDRLRSKEDLRGANLNLIGCCTPSRKYTPSLERSFMELELLVKQQALSKVFLVGLNEDDLTKRVISDYETIMKKAGLETETGCQVYESADELQKMTVCRGCVLFIEIGKATYPQIEQYIKLCERFRVDILGCVVLG